MTVKADYFFRTLYLSVLVLCVLGVTILSVYAEEEKRLTFEQAISLHDAARDGDVSATPRAVKVWEKIVRSEPQNAVANSYLGSSYALTARDANNVTDKIRFSNRGLRYLDLAVSIAPENFVVRIVRMSVSRKLPEMFGRSDKVVEDLLALDKIFSSSQAPAMSAYMVNVYELLEELASQQGDWKRKKALVQELAKEK